MKIVAYGQGSAGAGVAARRWRAGREVTGRGRVGDDRESREGSPAGRWWTLAAVCLGTFMLLLDISAVYVALPSIQQSLGASFASLQWIVDAYALSLAALLLTAGSLADVFGRRLFYVIGLAVFTGASLWCGLSTSTLELQSARVVQGAGGAIMFSVSLALLAQAFRGRDRGIAFGAWGAVSGLAVAVGPLLGGLLTSGLSWQWIFYLNLPTGVAAVIITLMRVAESRAHNPRRPDWPGFAVFTAALASLVYGLIESGQRTFGSHLVLGCLAAAGLLLIIFVIIERFTANPMFDLSLFRLPAFGGVSAAEFGLSASIFAIILFIVLYLQDVLGYSALGTGLRVLVLTGGILATSIPAGELSSRVPVRWLIGPGLIIVGAGLLLMRGLNAQSSWTHLVPGLLAAGLGVGVVNPPLASAAIGVVQPIHAGMASGISNTFCQVGLATGIGLLGTLFASQAKSQAIAGASQGPALAPRGGQIAAAVQSGTVGKLIAQLPAGARPAAESVARTAFTAGLNRILLVAAIIALSAGAIALATIRRKDLAASQRRPNKESH
jgi:EmrB/QacA subfamily drug resistance transporter